VTIRTLALLSLVVATMGAGVAGTQTSYCRPLDGTGQRLLSIAQRHATFAADSAYRSIAWKIPLLTPADVAYVTDETVCEQAALAYDHELSPETPSIGRGVYVIRLGTWYLVVDSESKAGEWMRGVILDATYAKHTEALLL
jgi:hypothetical protein